MMILSAAVAGVAALFVLAPLLGWGAAPAFDPPAAAKAGLKEEMLRQRQEILVGIKDLDLEYEVGKLTKEDYEKTRERLAQQAVEIYRQMDKDDRS